MGLFKSHDVATSGNTTTVRIDRDCHTLLVRRTSSQHLGLNLREGAPEGVSASIRSHTGKLEDVIKRALLGDLVVFSQYGGAPLLDVFTAGDNIAQVAAYMDIAEGIAVPRTGFYTTYLPIQLTADGLCVSTNGEDDFIFEFSNLIAGAKYDFIGLEGEASGTNILNYQVLDILQDQHERSLDVDNMVGVVMPSTTAFQRMVLTYANGRTSKFNMAELKYLSGLHNPAQVLSTSINAEEITSSALPSALSESLMMPLHSVTNIELDTDGSPLRFLTVFNRSRLVNY